MRIQIDLPQSLVNKVLALATKRDAKKVLFGDYSFIKGKTSLDSHILGLLGEQAVAYLFSQDLDETIYDTHGDYGFDLILPKYGKVDVKTTIYLDKPFLKVPVKDFCEDVDTYILCGIGKNSGSVIIIGYATKQEVKQARKISFKLRNGDRGPLNYVLYEHELHELKV